MAGTDDNYTAAVKQQILAAYGFDSPAELDAAIEEELPGYLAAEAEYNAERDAFAAELPGRAEEARRAVNERLQAAGILPDGLELEFELVPMDLQADAQWMAHAPQVQEADAAAPSDVLARIDAAIDDWEDGPDAAQWHPNMPEPDEAPPFAGIRATLDGEYVRPPRCRCSVVPARLEIPTTTTVIEFDTVPMPPPSTSAVRAVARPDRIPASAAGTAPIPMASEFQRQSALLLEGQLLAGALEAHGLLEGFMATIRNACESMVALSRALRLEPWPHGWNEPCFCHPKPFPAARDYRRRTKHRNRRRKS